MDLVTTIIASINGFVPLGLVLMLIVLAMAISFMLGKSFNIPQLTIFAEEEFHSTILTIGILLLIPTIVTILNLISLSLFNSFSLPHASWDTCYSQPTLQSVSLCYLSTMNQNTQVLLSNLVSKKFRLMQESAKFMTSFGMQEGDSITPEAWKNSDASYIDNVVMMFLVPAYISIYSQYIFISFFLSQNNFLLNILLPGGFLLRLIKPLRMAGNYIIALGLGIYTLLPFLFAINGLAYSYASTLNYSVFYDSVVGNMRDVINLLPQSVILPNFILVVLAAYLSAINNALRSFS